MTTAAKNPDDPLDKLVVIDSLVVGPPQVERRRLLAPYRVIRGKQTDSFEFLYTFDEDVFDPDDPAAQNLAAMMAAQIALNYGMFCDQIVFHGPLDRIDRRFLEEMLRNTAREIYVKKFLEPNPFLKDGYTDLPAIKRDTFARARLVFPDAVGTEAPLRPPWTEDRGKVAVLSSGGKESLLSYGLLEEMGYQPHGVYVNESGKHWFTALNAHRAFKDQPQTARVWTNSDRLFSWMLRRLPFIREDFSRVRSDEYPIRLWTVAVFLFGALPILRQRKIGRLVIGDEFDTTVRGSDHGIPHYHGLYDQSRYFDNAMSRYFARKGWHVGQFSMLRPLSELLVQKILVERYPHLQRHQVSCHAAHMEGDVVRPCGKCEKCRRVVGMLVALGADPTHCGYRAEQVPSMLARLIERGTVQESKVLEQVCYLLDQRGKLPVLPGGVATPKQRGEVMKLRFDPERSPMDDIPVDLREKLYRLFLKHSDGACERSGRNWIDFDPLHAPGLTAPYRFEPPAVAAPSPTDQRPNYLLGELTTLEAKRRFKEVDVALLPVGAIEQHGPHLPLDTDAFDADYLARQVAAHCSDPKPLVLPLIPYGVSYHHDDFSGTISIGPETLAKFVHEVGMSVARHGINKLVIINGHGGNVPSLNFAAQMINRDAQIFTCVDSGETSDTDIDDIVETAGDVHAGEVETSTSLAIRPELVHVNKIKRFVPSFSSHYLDFSSKRGVDWYAQTSKISPSGVLGDPTKASRRKGERIWAVMIEHLVALVEDLKSMSLDEIHQKRM